MYRATAEIVSGTRVYADGKWLRCIGNKRVSVGDRIWTDGRCVYGHEQEAQQPQVIITPQEDDEGIPILLRNETSSEYKFYSFHKQLSKELPVPENFSQSKYWAIINSQKRPVYLLEAEPKCTYERVFYDLYYPEMTLKTTCTLALNVDKSGNIYELKKELLHTFPHNPEITKVFVVKNGTKIKEISCKAQMDKMIETMKSKGSEITPGFSTASVTRYKYVRLDPDWELSPEQPAIESTFYVLGQYFGVVAWQEEEKAWYNFSSEYSHTPWGVIEDENHWAFLNSVEIALDTFKFTKGSFPTGAIETNDTFMYGWDCCLYTPNGHERIFHAFGGSTILADHTAAGYFDKKSSPPKNTPLPIQDGYYFTINEISEAKPPSSSYDCSFTLPKTMTASIYTPQNQLLLTQEFHLGTYFTICKHKNKILFGVDDRDGCGLKDRDFFREIPHNAKTSIESGIYQLRNQELIPIAKGNLRNWKLRPLKKLRNWQNRLKSIEIEQEEI